MPANKTSFKPGNTARMVTGTRSPTIVKRRAAEVREELSAVLAEHLSLAPSDAPLLDAAVDVVTKLKLLNEYHDRVSGGSLISLRGKPYASAQIYVQLMRLAISIFDRLGIGPAARADILGNLGPSISLAGQLAARRNAKAALEAPKE